MDQLNCDTRCIALEFGVFYNISGVQFLNSYANLNVMALFTVHQGFTSFLLDGIVISNSSFGNEVLDTGNIEMALFSVSNVHITNCHLDSRSEFATVSLYTCAHPLCHTNMGENAVRVIDTVCCSTFCLPQ